eukprot:14673840-Ditylum_brightwellii.AAC.1
MVVTGGGCFAALSTHGNCVSFGGVGGNGTLRGGNKMGANGEAGIGHWRASMRSLAAAVAASADKNAGMQQCWGKNSAVAAIWCPLVEGM